MNILQLTVHFAPNVGGVETHLLDLIETLIKKRNNIFVLTYRPLVVQASWKIFEKKQNLTIWRLPWLRGLFYFFVSRPLLEFLYLTPGLFVVAPFIIMSRKIDVVHAHGLIAGFVGVFWGKLFRKRVIISLHNIYHFPKEGFYTKFVRWMFVHADKVICLSQQSVDEVEKLGVAKKSVSKFTYWIDLKAFVKVTDAKKKVGWEKKFVVLFVGRLVPEKGIRELLEAASFWKKGIFLAIAGTGPLTDVIKKQQKENCIFLGKIDNKNLPLYYSAADVLIVPSMHEEGFGRVLLESLACGTPVVAANRGAIPEAVDTSVGVLITITPKNIAHTIDMLFDNPVKRKALSDKARSFAENRYSEKNIEDILRAYQE